jgi:membrane-associated phospholipid phosphatase
VRSLRITAWVAFALGVCCLIWREQLRGRWFRFQSAHPCPRLPAPWYDPILTWGGAFALVIAIAALILAVWRGWNNRLWLATTGAIALMPIGFALLVLVHDPTYESERGPGVHCTPGGRISGP